MSGITRHNYEEFFLDYLDGTLSSDQMNELEAFLIQNPDLKKELEEMDCPVLAQESISLERDSLKEIPFKTSFDDFCIARLEGDLSVDNEIAFDLFLEKNESLKKESKIYQKTVLIPDEQVVFEKKEELKKSDRKIAFWWYFSRVGIAASVLLLFSLWNIFYQFDEENSEIKSISQVQPDERKIEKVIVEKKLPVEKALEVEAEIEIPEAINIPKKELLVTNKAKSEPKIEIESIAEKVTIPILTTNSSVALLANQKLEEVELKEVKNTSIQTTDPNSGLAELGMSWKSSEPKKKSSVLYALAKFGVDKIGEIAGKNVKLEKTYDSVTEKTRLNFKSEGIGFSKTIK